MNQDLLSIHLKTKHSSKQLEVNNYQIVVLLYFLFRIMNDYFWNYAIYYLNERWSKQAIQVIHIPLELTTLRRKEKIKLVINQFLVCDYCGKMNSQPNIRWNNKIVQRCLADRRAVIVMLSIHYLQAFINSQIKSCIACWSIVKYSENYYHTLVKCNFNHLTCSKAAQHSVAHTIE